MSKKYLPLAGAVFCGLFICVHSVFAIVGTNVITIQSVMVAAGPGAAFAGTFDDLDNYFAYGASNPHSVVAADVNGNGHVDLISANSGDDTLTVYTNDGSGNFVLASAPSLGGGRNPYAVVAADVNGDGKMDLISANNGNGTLTVYTNKSGGNFVLASTPTVGSQPWSVAAADIKGDGKIALISANRIGDSLTVLTNKGAGVFVFNATYTVGNYPRCVIAADVNGDGYADLISANYYDNTLTVLTNNRSGIFGYNATWSVDTHPTCVIAADVNGDGHVDLISANLYYGTLSVLTNNGTGGFALSSTLDVGSDPYSVTAADVNGDGYVDLISANGDGTLTVLTNDGSGGFVLASTPYLGDTLISITAADVNGDGGMDLICANYDDSYLMVMLNTELPSFLNGVAISWSTNATGFVLQQNGDLTTTDWLDVSVTPTVTNKQKRVIIAPLVDNQYYRLRHP